MPSAPGIEPPSHPDTMCDDPNLVLGATLSRVIDEHSYREDVLFGQAAYGAVEILKPDNNGYHTVLASISFNQVPALPFRACVPSPSPDADDPERQFSPGTYIVRVRLQQVANQNTIGDMINTKPYSFELPAEGLSIPLTALEACNAPATAEFSPGGECLATDLPE